MRTNLALDVMLGMPRTPRLSVLCYHQVLRRQDPLLPGEPAADFMIEGPAQHGLPGLVHLFGIESPGLTSALSLAEDVAGYLDA